MKLFICFFKQHYVTTIAYYYTLALCVKGGGGVGGVILLENMLGVFIKHWIVMLKLTEMFISFLITFLILNYGCSQVSEAIGSLIRKNFVFTRQKYYLGESDYKKGWKGWIVFQMKSPNSFPCTLCEHGRHIVY